MDNRLKEIIDNSKNIVFFGGAGVSTESNIPDFRSESGLYNAQRKYGRSPEEMLSHSFFVSHTDTFFDYYKNNLIYLEAEPNKAHRALAKLEKEGKLKADVVLYEEALDEDCMMGAIRAIQQADTMIIGGTSLVVYPAAGLIRYFGGNKLVLINKQATPYDSQADLVINDSIGKVMDLD